MGFTLLGVGININPFISEKQSLEVGHTRIKTKPSWMENIGCKFEDNISVYGQPSVI